MGARARYVFSEEKKAKSEGRGKVPPVPPPIRALFLFLFYEANGKNNFPFLSLDCTRCTPLDCQPSDILLFIVVGRICAL